MRLVGARVGERELEGGNQFDVERLIAQVAQLDLPEFNVVLRAHPHGGMGLHLVPGSVETYPVGVEDAFVPRPRVRRRMPGDGHRPLAATPAQVKEAAQRIAQRVVAPARIADLAPAAPARAVGAQRHAVAPVGEHVGGLQRAGARHHFAQQTRYAAALQGAWQRARWRRVQHRDLARRAFVQQRRHRSHVGIGHAPALRHAAQQHIGQCHDGHALVVRHERAHGRESLGAGLPRRREVERLDKAVLCTRVQCLQRRKIKAGGVRGNLRRQAGCVGRDHQFVAGRAAQRQAGNPLRRVLVGQRVVAGGIGRLGDAPGHVLRPRIGNLLDQRRVVGAAQQAAVRLVQDQRGHQVLEHRA